MTEELIKRDKTNLDIFWLKDKGLEGSENLPEPAVLAQEILDDLQPRCSSSPPSLRAGVD